MFKEGDKVVLTRNTSVLTKGSVVKFGVAIDNTRARVHVPTDDDDYWYVEIDALRLVKDSRLFPKPFRHEYDYG